MYLKNKNQFFIKMPTQYSNCKECRDVSHMTNILPNDSHENNILIFNILMNKTLLPPKICELILKHKNSYANCTLCRKLLCEEHGKRAGKYYKHYRYGEGYMCDSCCWFEIS
jgi:hypothetical protein